MKNRLKPYLVVLFLFIFCLAKGQHYLTTTTYNQNFNTIGQGGTVHDISTLPAGWSFRETGTFTNNFYRGDNGADGQGDTYSYGPNGSAERALGSQATSQTKSVFGITFVNTTGSTITALTISYTGEKWHAGSFNRSDSLLFHYQLHNSLWTNNAWTAVPQLNYISNPTSGAFQLDGNDPANQKTISFTLMGLSITNQDTFALRWTDIDIVYGNDDGMAIDDFSMTAYSTDVFSPAVSGMNPSSGTAVSGTTLNASLQFSEPVKKGTGNIRVLSYPGNVAIQSINISDPSVSISGQQVSFSVTGLAKEKDYQVLIDSAAIKDLADNNFDGIKPSEWIFNVLSDSDSLRPVVDTLFPTPGYQLSTNYLTFRVYMNEPLSKGSGKIYIKNTTDQVVKSYSVDSSAVQISGNQLYFKPDFLNTGNYYITMDSGAVKDRFNNNFTGFKKGRWPFSINTILGVPIDNHALTINTRTPAHTAANVNPSKLEIYWYEYALEEYGFINIRNYYTDSLVQQVNVTSPAVTTSANYTSININPLPAGTYYVDIQPGVFMNIPGTEFAGTNKTNWRFTVAGDDHIPMVIVSADPVNGTTDMQLNGRLTLKFNKLLQAAPQIGIKRYSDDVLVSNSSTSTTDSLVQIDYGNPVLPLQYNTRYYADISPGMIRDLGGFYTTPANFNKDAWSFTTKPAPTSYQEEFTNCVLPFSDPGGIMTASTKGASRWSCTPAGNNNSQGSVIDGNVNNVPEENLDWLILPGLDLSSMNIPVLRFYSKTQKTGVPLKLLVSTDYVAGTSPGLSNWTQIDGKFPGINSNVWQKSDSINLSAFKTKNTSICFQYNSSVDSASAWSIDDILVYSVTSVITAVNEVYGNKPQLTIYGNPAYNRVQAKLSGIAVAKVKVEVFNDLGILMTQKTSGPGGLIDIDVKNWKKGMYIITAHYGNNTISGKVMLQ